MEQIKPTLADFFRIADALKAGGSQGDLGNALVEGLEETLKRDMDSTDFERALLYLELEQLSPLIILWRRRFIERALVELDAGKPSRLCVYEDCDQARTGAGPYCKHHRAELFREQAE